MKKLTATIFVCLLIYTAEAQTISNFHLKDTENTSKSFNELKGEKLTLIDFWATWCKPCNKAIPELNKIYEEYSEKGVQIIGINCDGPRSVSKVAPFVNSLKIKYPVLMDINSEVMNNLSLSAFPTLIIIDPKGKIVWIHEGYSEGDNNKIKTEIDKYLSTM